MDIRDCCEELNALLKPEQFKDYGPNGLQIEGKRPVRRIATAVTASLEAIEQAAAWQADALLVHHGLFWEGDSRCLVGHRLRRIEAILNAGMHVLAYHLPLDAHAELGNNRVLGDQLELQDIRSMSDSGEGRWVYRGRLKQPLTVAEWSKQLAAYFNRVPQVLEGDPQKTISEIMWCTGAAERYFNWAIDEGVDAYLTGEVSEYCVHMARESGVHFFGCGHHATERGGVQALGNYLAQRWKCEHRYFELESHY